MSIVSGNDWSSHHPLCQGRCFFGICLGTPHPLDCLRAHIVQALSRRLARPRPTDPPPSPVPDDPLAPPLTPSTDPPISPYADRLAARNAALAEYLQSLQDLQASIHLLLVERARQIARDRVEARRAKENEERARRPKGADAAGQDDGEEGRDAIEPECDGLAASQERMIEERIDRFISRTVDGGLRGIRRAWMIILRYLNRLPEESQRRMANIRHWAEYYIARTTRYLRSGVPSCEVVF
jgi:hypothetical protein